MKANCKYADFFTKMKATDIPTISKMLNPQFVECMGCGYKCERLDLSRHRMWNGIDSFVGHVTNVKSRYQSGEYSKEYYVHLLENAIFNDGQDTARMIEDAEQEPVCPKAAMHIPEEKIQTFKELYAEARAIVTSDVVDDQTSKD